MNVAVPVPSSVTPEASVVAPSMNVTVPVGVPVFEAVTTAVSVIAPPKTDGLVEDVSTSVTPSTFTVWVRPEVLVAKLESDPYVAVMA